MSLRNYHGREKRSFHQGGGGGKRPDSYKKRAFVAATTPSGKVMVVKNRNGEWMLTGGYADGDERLSKTASRELFEEAGVRAHSSKMKKMQGGKASIYRHELNTFPDRNFTFGNRSTPWETVDRGFVDPRDRVLTVRDSNGKVKSNSTLLRKGTASAIRTAVPKECADLMSRCHKHPKTCVGQGHTREYQRKCGSRA